MDADQKREVNAAMQRLDLNQAALARQLGIKPQTLSRIMLHIPVINARSAWPAVLDALGLEMTMHQKAEK